jgi:hypothetical protein
VARAEPHFHLWHPEECYRVVRLGVCFPDLLTHDEERACKLVRENDFVWKTKFQKLPSDRRWAALLDEPAIDWDRVRDWWPVFLDVGRGVRPPSELPVRKSRP